MKDLFKKISQFFGNLGIITLGAFLGAISGQGMKWLRRFIFPLIFTLYALYVVRSWWCITIYCMAGVLSIGYGIPELNGIVTLSIPKYFSDEGSVLGRFWYRKFNGDTMWANIFTRGTVGLLISITMLSVPILTNNWVSYFLGSVGIILIWALVSWKGFGEIPVKLFGKTYNLLKVDLVTYAVTSCGLILIINGWLG